MPEGYHKKGNFKTPRLRQLSGAAVNVLGWPVFRETACDYAAQKKKRHPGNQCPTPELASVLIL